MLLDGPGTGTGDALTQKTCQRLKAGSGTTTKRARALPVHRRRGAA
jgi:hypothetical protein